MSNGYWEFQDILNEINAYMVIMGPEAELSEIRKMIVKLEQWRSEYLLPDSEFEFTNDECPHDWVISKCVGCGYEAG